MSRRGSAPDVSTTAVMAAGGTGARAGENVGQAKAFGSSAAAAGGSRRAALGEITNSAALNTAGAQAGKGGKAGKAGPTKRALRPRSAAATAGTGAASGSSRTRSGAGGGASRRGAAPRVDADDVGALPAVPDIDSADAGNPLAASEFVGDIYSHYREVEAAKCAAPKYLDNQPDINEKMRAILIDWLIEVHLKFKLSRETMYLTVNLIDRYLERTTVLRQKLQLVGVTAMLIASKYEEIYAPEVRDFEYITENSFTKKEILSMECDMLCALRFEITVPTQYVFVNRFLKAAAATQRTWYQAHYFCERMLQESRMLRYQPSMIAAAAVLVALKARRVAWTATLQGHTGYSEEDLRSCAGDMLGVLQVASESSLKAVRKKYASKRYHEVASLPLPEAL